MLTELIAITTTSGKVYYQLVKILRKENIPFLSLKPTDPIPLHVKVVITTEDEQRLIQHPQILVYEEGDEAAEVVDKAIQIAYGKEAYEQVVVGVDPGKTFGIAVVGDEGILKSMSCSSVYEAVDRITTALNDIKAGQKIVKIGDGASVYREKLINLLDRVLSPEVVIETVSEKGTTRIAENTSPHRRGVRDAMSAIKISMRSGRKLRRSYHE